MRTGRASLLLLFALLLSTGLASAQDNPPAVGVMAGVNNSYYATVPDQENSAKPSAMVGAFAVLRRDRMLKIQPEVQFTQRKVDVKFAGIDSTYSISYFSLGVMLRTTVYKGLYSNSGVQYMMPMKATWTIASDADVKDNIENDVSLVIGLGYQAGRIGIEGRWDSGINRLEEVPLGAVKRNRAITVMASLGF